MALLADEDVKYLTESFSGLAHDVTLTVVTKERSRLIVPGAEPEEEDASAEVKQIATELKTTSPRLKLVEIDAAADGERARELAGERVPAIALSSSRARGKLRYVGLPAGYEMSTLVAAIHDLGDAASPLPPDIDARLAALKEQIHIQVFVTPT